MTRRRRLMRSRPRGAAGGVEDGGCVPPVLLSSVEEIDEEGERVTGRIWSAGMGAKGKERGSRSRVRVRGSVASCCIPSSVVRPDPGFEVGRLLHK